MPDRFSIQIVTPPAIEPVAIDDLKLHARIDGDDEDSLLAVYIAAAREECEAKTGRAFLPTTFRLSLDRFPAAPGAGYRDVAPFDVVTVSPAHQAWPLDPAGRAILLPRSPLRSVMSVTYYDTAGTEQTLAADNYVVDTASEPPRIVPAEGTDWPAAQARPGAVRVTFQAGYADAASVPASAKLAVLLMAAALNEHREQVTAERLSEQPVFQHLLGSIAVPNVW